MSASKVSIIVFALCAGLCTVQAAGGIKGGLQRADSSIKSPFARPPAQQQQYLPPPPPPPPQQLLPPPPPPQQLLPPPPPPPPQPIKGPVFSAARVAPAQQQQIVQQQQEIVQQQQEAPVVQQVQQQEEIDPNAAAQEAGPAIAAPALAAPLAAAGASEEEANPRPEPYAFQYAFEAGDSATSGSSQREEQQDANGRVTGFYTLKGEDGRDRRVDYVADASGFRATISTNEMGTAPKDSADVDWNAQSPSDGQLRVAESATQAARQRALQNPQAASGSGSASASASSSQFASAQKSISSPRQNVAGAASSGRPSKINFQQAQQQQNVANTQQQLQEPFEQIRQVELNGRARKSRHAPFYLYTI